MRQESSHVTAVERAIDILEYIGTSVNSVTINELSEKLGIPGSSCFRIVKNLTYRGYLSESSQMNGRYKLSFKILNLAEQVKLKLDIRSIAINHMRKIAQETQHAVQLGVLQEDVVIYIEQVLPNRVVNVIASLQEPLSINVSTAGKVLCAFLPLYQRIPFVQKSKFDNRTENSIMDKEKFLEYLQQVNKERFAIDLEEYSIGIGCLSMPIFDYQDQCIASLGITGDIVDYQNEKKLSAMKSILHEACTEISSRFGYKFEENEG